MQIPADAIRSPPEKYVYKFARSERLLKYAIFDKGRTKMMLQRCNARLERPSLNVWPVSRESLTSELKDLYMFSVPVIADLCRGKRNAVKRNLVCFTV